MCVFLGVSAQENNTMKFGFLSYEAALQSMPDYTLAQNKLAELKAQYQTEAKRVEDEFNRKYEEFLEGQREFPKTILQKRQTELQELMEKNIAFRDESRRQLAAAEQEAMQPLKTRLNEVIAEIAGQQQLALVINTDANACPFIDPTMGVNIDQLVQDALQ